MDTKTRIEELVQQLNAAAAAYYGGQDEIMSNYEWDAAFDELARLEEETGYILPDSPTQNVGTEAEEAAGNREPHEYPALSLAKTKQIPELQKWAGDQEIWLSWKLDGLTLVATYDGGMLTKLLTRGNGTLGNNITYLKDAIRGLPPTVDYMGHLVVRGEAAISYPDFEAINDALEDEDEKYANPRNLASGTLALDAKHIDKVRERCLTFHAFTLVHLDEALVSWGNRMKLLDSLGFTTVDREKTDASGLPDAVARWTERVESGAMQIPVDGLVICYDDTDYAAGGSVTGHHATRAGFAFKWQDTAMKTLLKYIEWSCAAASITPVAVLEPVQLEGTTVSRASLVNISELERLGIGENGKTEVEVIKANKIIPKCIKVVRREGTFSIPEACPVCGAPTQVRVSDSGTKTLKCTQDKCPAKNLKKFQRFVSKPGMDIDGLSIETLRDFINMQFLHDYADIWSLKDHGETIRTMEGYGDRSCQKLLDAVEKSRRCSPVNLIYALCIPLIGVDAAKRFMAACGWQGFLERLRSGIGFEDIDGIGSERSNAVCQWYADEDHRDVFEKLLSILDIEQLEPKKNEGGTCQGVTFCITGDVHLFKNRDAFKAYVEAQGGKVTGSVSKKTNYLVNNDVESTSSKNKKARELSIPILSEEDFVSQFGFPD